MSSKVKSSTYNSFVSSSLLTDLLLPTDTKELFDIAVSNAKMFTDGSYIYITNKERTRYATLKIVSRTNQILRVKLESLLHQYGSGIIQAGSVVTAAGKPGNEGSSGSSATIQVGIVTIGPANAAPVIVNVGTSQNAILDFTLPLTYGSSDWDSITGKPTFATVAFSGSYNDLSDKPSGLDIPTNLSELTNDVGYLTEVTWSDISSKPTFSSVAISGSYLDLSNKPTIPTIPTNISEFTNDVGYLTTVAWSAVTGKPSFATVATSGSYLDLSNKPIIPTLVSQLTNDSGYLTTVSWASITGKPSFSTVATSGSYVDLSNKPTIPTLVSQLTNDSGFITNVTISGKEDVANKGQALGYVPLNASIKIDYTYLPDTILGQLKYQTVWDASTNTPTLPAAGSSNEGHYYIVSVNGSTNLDGITDWKVGDWAVSNGIVWNKIDNTDAVSSVAGRTGAITLTKADVNLPNVDDTADLDKPISTLVQTALNGKFDIPTGTLSQYITGTGSVATFPTIPTLVSQLTNDSGYLTAVNISGKQDTLVSGTNIKTINGNTILGSGDLVINAGLDITDILPYIYALG